MTFPSPQPDGLDQLALLYRISQAFNSTLDLDQVLNRVMDEVIVAVRAERGFLMLHDEATETLSFRAARGLDQSTIDEPEFEVSRGIVERVAHEGVPLLTSNAQSDDWLSERRSVMLLGLRSVLCVPLQVKANTLGVIYVDNRVQAGIFTQQHLELLSSIAASAAIAIENARLYQLAVEKGRIERELQAARELQASLLPRNPPACPGWDIAARWLPARQVAGDYYDFFPSADGLLRLVIADVADKGYAAALFMALARSTLRAAATLHPGAPAQAIQYANRLICADSPNSTFITLFYAEVDPASGVITYVNAGHNPPLLLSGNIGSVRRMERTGMAVGADEKSDYTQESLVLLPGDRLLLFTDGVTDARNPGGDYFDEWRLQAIFRDHPGSAADTAKRVIAAVQDFSGSHEQDDDLTLIAILREEG